MADKTKHIIITGASRGFGRDLALELADDHTIFHLVARSDMADVAKELESTGAIVHIRSRDLTEMTHFHSLMDDISKQLDAESTGFLGLVNNAGTLEPIGPAGKYDFDKYRQNLELNYVTPLMLTHAFLETFQELPVEKRVVMVSSGASGKPYFGWSHYCSTKAGVDMFVQVVGIEQLQKEHPVEIMAFNPGRIATDMQKLIRETSEEDFPMVNDFVEAWKDGRIGDSREVASRLARQLLTDYFPSGKVLSHRDI